MNEKPATQRGRPAYGSHRMWWLPAAVQVEANATDHEDPGSRRLPAAHGHAEAA